MTKEQQIEEMLRSYGTSDQQKEILRIDLEMLCVIVEKEELQKNIT